MRSQEETSRLNVLVAKVFGGELGIPTQNTAEFIAGAISRGMLPKSQLVDGEYYYGRCRNARVARWDEAANRFRHMRTKWGHVFAEDIKHPEDDDGFDLFVPVELVTPEPNEIVREAV